MAFDMHRINKDDIDLFQNSCNFLEKSCDFLKTAARNPERKIETDCAEGNLSWLLNYKIHELPPVPGSSIENENYCSVNSNNDGIIIGTVPNRVPFKCDSVLKTRNTIEQDPLNVKQDYLYKDLKKPPFTYTELIEYALSEKGELTVSGIYQWISEHFPFYKQNDDRWKNSVRHNLSINPHFRKGGKAIHGAGHLWTIAQKDSKKSMQIKQRMKQFMQKTYRNTQAEDDFDMEVQAATASILESANEFYTGDDNNKEREIQFLNVVEVDKDLKDSFFTEFLAPPVPKQQIVHECGLGNEFVTLDSSGASVLTEGEDVIHDGHFYEDTHFTIYYDLEKE